MNTLRTCLAFFSALEDHDVDRILPLCSPDARAEFTPLGERVKGTVAELGNVVWSSLVETFPDLKIKINNIIWSVDRQRAECHITFQGTQRYPFLGIDPSGNSLNIVKIFKLSFDRDGKINSVQVSWQHNEFINQLISRHNR